MRALLDTCVIAELRRRGGNVRVRHAIEALPEDQLFISVISVGEISKGIALLPDKRHRERESLAAWLMEMERQFTDRIVPIDSETSHIWGEITARAQKTGSQIPAADGLIAATALRHGLHIFTRNIRDFVATGALIIDPWNHSD